MSGGEEPEDERVERQWRDALRDAFSYWATGVTILAVREEPTGTVHALTVSGFMPVSLEPPLVLVSLGANASALPYLDAGGQFVVSLLGPDQQGLASRYADTYPVGPSPFEESGPPRVRGSVASLTCAVDEMLERGDHTLVIGRVLHASSTNAESALAYFRRQYHTIGRGDPDRSTHRSRRSSS